MVIAVAKLRGRRGVEAVAQEPQLSQSPAQMDLSNRTLNRR